jgi:hypothetical protein
MGRLKLLALCAWVKLQLYTDSTAVPQMETQLWFCLYSTHSWGKLRSTIRWTFPNLWAFFCEELRNRIGTEIKKVAISFVVQYA